MTAIGSAAATVPGTRVGPTAETGGVRLGRAAEVPVGEGRAYAVGGEQVAVFRLSTGALRAVSALCPHAGGPLADGQIDDQVVICPLHLNVYELDSGRCRAGQSEGSDRSDLRTYPVEEDAEGYLVLDLSP